ncbi:MAG: hypothetical protein ACLRFH_04860 [Opitutales bacterium]
MASGINGNANINLEFATAKMDLAIISKNKVENKFTSFFRKIFANKRHKALKNMANGDFTNRTKVKAFKKHSELAKALSAYDNGKPTTSLNNEDKLTIDDIKTFVNSNDYTSNVKYEKLSKLLFVNGFHEKEDFRNLYAKCALDVKNFYTYLRYVSPKDLEIFLSKCETEDKTSVVEAARKMQNWETTTTETKTNIGYIIKNYVREDVNQGERQEFAEVKQSQDLDIDSQSIGNIENKWQDFVKNASAEALLKHIDENPGDADKIFEATIQVGKPFEGITKMKFPKEYEFNDRVAEYAKERKNYKTFLVFANADGIYDRCVNDPDLKKIYKAAKQLKEHSNSNKFTFAEFVLQGALKHRKSGK